MKIKLHINYRTTWGQNIFVYGSIPELGNWEESKAIKMSYSSSNMWSADIDVKNSINIEYKFFVKENTLITATEWGLPHSVQIAKNKIFDIYDNWQEAPSQKFLYTSGFRDSFFRHNHEKLKYYKETIVIKVNCPYIKNNQILILCGSSDTLGNWDAESALHFIQTTTGEWQLAINAMLIKKEQEYKLAIYDNIQKKIIHWDEGQNRILTPLNDETNLTRIESLNYRHSQIEWKAAGVSIPVFSLRSNDSFGIGEFSDLKKMVDWAYITGQKIIQILPINDTTATKSWLDSYPYNAISIYALHPIYLGLKSYKLRNKELYKTYEKEASTLNKLSEVDYEKVFNLKWRYFYDLFIESGDNTLESKDYLDFFETNKEWLFPYACFSYLRDKYKTAQFSVWEEHSIFNRNKLETLIETNKEADKSIKLLYFVQYLLHKQLIEVKEYAHQHGVILKGDIPIGINRDSVEAWTEPHLFNMDTQTGAPPDEFSYYGQNWGFPTYNWKEMAKDGFEWWTKRFRKMADYFDAYRIDHILGFFRIWEIPLSSIQGILGHFSPALPFSIEEIQSYGLLFDEYQMTNPFIQKNILETIFGDKTHEVINKYLNLISNEQYELKEEYNTQSKVNASFINKLSTSNIDIRDGLYDLCNEVLFIRDKHEPSKYHPRITAQFTHAYKKMNEEDKDAFNRLYNDFFYHRHSQYWRDRAMAKLPALISSTSMLVCGEDLGMVPDCVPSVMQELQILSLEIERMPKNSNSLFNNLKTLPYLSVCTTSTHDMSPIRLWWKENKDITQKYYNLALNMQGIAPEECSADICEQIITNHLNSRAMLAIIPLQDWLSINDKMKRANPEQERINVPAIAQYYWRYRMHLTLEELIESESFNKKISSMIDFSYRN